MATLLTLAWLAPWAADASESAVHLVEVALGRYSPGVLADWGPSDGFDAVAAASRMPGDPNVWTDGSLVRDQVTGVSSSGAGFFAHQPENCWGDRRWGHVNRVRPEGEVQSCRGFCSVPGPLCGASFWLSADAVHLGVDKLAVVRHVGRLLGGRSSSTPLVLVTDGDLLLLTAKMLHLRGLDTVQITKVMGHADEEMVLEGRVRELDRLGNHAADEAADFGRRRVGNLVIGARRNLSGVCGRWYPFILDLYRLFIAISGAVVNRDGSDGTALDPLVWSAGAWPGGAG